MAKKYERSNESLVILAQRGCELVREEACEQLIRRNEGLIYKTALTCWNYVLNSDIDRSLTLDDLVQVGRIKLWESISAFDPLRGTKFTTFLATVLHNRILDEIRPGLKEKEEIGGEFQWLDHYEGSEDQLTFIEKYADPYQKKPEPILLEKEFRQEVFASLDDCAPREKTYLAYRFGYPDDDERSKKNTREHFGISEIRAERLERQACAHFKENYLAFQPEPPQLGESNHVLSCVSPREADEEYLYIRWV